MYALHRHRQKQSKVSYMTADIGKGDWVTFTGPPVPNMTLGTVAYVEGLHPERGRCNCCEAWSHGLVLSVPHQPGALGWCPYHWKRIGRGPGQMEPTPPATVDNPAREGVDA